MTQTFFTARRDYLVRDLLRDFCIVRQTLRAQRARFIQDGSVSSAVLSELLGQAISKGVFWRLKDVSHFLFRRPPQADSAMRAGALLDWVLGCAFHECVKLHEDAFQSRHYVNSLLLLKEQSAPFAAIYESLRDFSSGVGRTAGRELDRIQILFTNALDLLLHFLAGEGENRHLAHWLAENEDLAKSVFGPRYGELLHSLYGEASERLYLLAAEDLLAACRHNEARDLLCRAGERGLLSGAVEEIFSGLACRICGECCHELA